MGKASVARPPTLKVGANLRRIKRVYMNLDLLSSNENTAARGRQLPGCLGGGTRSRPLPPSALSVPPVVFGSAASSSSSTARQPADDGRRRAEVAGPRSPARIVCPRSPVGYDEETYSPRCVADLLLHRIPSYALDGGDAGRPRPPAAPAAEGRARLTRPSSFSDLISMMDRVGAAQTA